VVSHFSHVHKLLSKPFVRRRRASAPGSANGSKVSCSPILITKATSEKRSGLGMRAIPTTGVNIETATRSMHNPAQIHNEPELLTTPAA